MDSRFRGNDNGWGGPAFWIYALRLPAHCVRGRLSALPSAPAAAGLRK